MVARSSGVAISTWPPTPAHTALSSCCSLCCVQGFVPAHCGTQGSRSLLVSIVCLCVCVCVCVLHGVCGVRGVWGMWWLCGVCGVRGVCKCDSLWLSCAGMLTITDFIHILRHHYKSPIVSLAHPLVGQPHSLCYLYVRTYVAITSSTYLHLPTHTHTPPTLLTLPPTSSHSHPSSSSHCTHVCWL